MSQPRCAVRGESEHCAGGAGSVAQMRPPCESRRVRRVRRVVNAAIIIANVICCVE